jgi:hypothetical protein
MSLFQKLKTGILAPGLCLFGDNAYFNTLYMATPYAAVSGGSKDAYNSYHLQLQIRMECTFRIMTHRWSILRSAIPVNVSTQKTVAHICRYFVLQNDITTASMPMTMLSCHVQSRTSGEMRSMELFQWKRRSILIQ